MAMAGLVLSGCGTRLNKAPVEDRGTSTSSAPAQSGQPGVVVGTPIKPLPGAENAGKPGYYTVKPGDTLIRIGLESGQSWKDLARWNNLDNANLIEVGQVLRVAPPTAAAAATAVASDNGVVTRPVTSSTVAPAPAASAASTPKPPASAASGTVVAVAPATPAPAAAPAGEDDIAFIWPASGSLIAGFDEARNKGFDIAGKAGEPVLAAADGRVVYAGAGLRGGGRTRCRYSRPARGAWRTRDCRRGPGRHRSARRCRGDPAAPESAARARSVRAAPVSRAAGGSA